MNIYFYRSLDRPVDIFGLRGQWIVIFLCIVGAIFFFALVVGFIMGTGTAICVLILGAAVAFLVCLIRQSRIPPREVGKYRYRSACYMVLSRRETVGRCLLPEPETKSLSYDQ